MKIFLKTVAVLVGAVLFLWVCSISSDSYIRQLERDRQEIRDSCKDPKFVQAVSHGSLTGYIYRCNDGHFVETSDWFLEEKK